MPLFYKILNSLISVVMTSSFAYEPYAQHACLVGSENNSFVADTVSGAAPVDTFLSQFQNRIDPLACEITRPMVRSQVRDLSEYLNFGVSRDCVREAMLEIPNLKKPPTYRVTCPDDTSKFSGEIVSGHKDQCITEDVVDYVHWAFNKGLQCINAIADEPVDPHLTFKKILRESKFGFYLSNINGRGLGQLTSIAMEEMAKKEHAGYQYIERARKESKCEVFHPVLKNEVTFFGESNSAVNTCQLLNPVNGIGRNIFFSLALFVHNRDTHASAMGRFLKYHGITDQDKINYLNTITYGRNGFAKAKATYRVIARRYEPDTGEKINRMPLSDFIAELRKESRYIDQIERTFETFSKKISGARTCIGPVGI